MSIILLRAKRVKEAYWNLTDKKFPPPYICNELFPKLFSKREREGREREALQCYLCRSVLIQTFYGVRESGLAQVEREGACYYLPLSFFKYCHLSDFYSTALHSGASLSPPKQKIECHVLLLIYLLIWVVQNLIFYFYWELNSSCLLILFHLIPFIGISVTEMEK